MLAERRTDSVKANPWVDQANEHIHGKIDGNHDCDREQGNALDRGVIAIANRIDHQAAKSRPIEYRFRDDCASQQGSKIHPYNGYDWDQRISESMIYVHLRGAQAFRSCG